MAPEFMVERSFRFSLHYSIILYSSTLMGSTQKEPIHQEEYVFMFKEMVKSTKLATPEAHYDILQLLGEGCYSQVFKVRSLATDKFFVLKKVVKLKNPSFNQNLMNEYQILRQMDHPNIIKMYEMFEDQQYFYIITEYLEGRDAHELMQEWKSISEEKAYTLIYQMLLALSYLHNNKVMHRDIKLENVIFDEASNSLKLIDFGSALKFQKYNPRQRRCTGTIHYIAPEVLNKYYNHQCDIWSMGIFLFVLLSGNAPFFDVEDNKSINKILTQPLAFISPIWKSRSNQVKTLIRKMLEKNFQQRITLKDILKDPWVLKFKDKKSINIVERQMVVNCLENMEKFCLTPLSKIQLGVLIFMINFIVKTNNQVGLMRAFNIINIQEDGEIEEQQIKAALVDYRSFKNKAAQEMAKKIMNKIDIDSSLCISYSEFILSASNLREVLTAENLDKTFKYIDTDHSGGLSVRELQARLGDNVDKSYYVKLVQYFDKNGDGEISKGSFQKMMRDILRDY